MQKELKKLGFTYNESRVFLSLLRLGKSRVGAIIDDLHVHRQIAYNNLKALEERGLIKKSIKNNTTYYQVTNPKAILESIQEQELIARKVSQKVAQEMKKTKVDHEINTYEDQRRIRKFFLDKHMDLRKGATLYGISPLTDKYYELMGEDLLQKIQKIRNYKKIKAKLLVDKEVEDKIKKVEKIIKASMGETRVLPYAVPTTTVIWPDSVTIQSLTEEKPFIIEIKNKMYRDSQLKHFQFLWKSIKNRKVK